MLRPWQEVVGALPSSLLFQIQSFALRTQMQEQQYSSANSNLVIFDQALGHNPSQYLPYLFHFTKAQELLVHHQAVLLQLLVLT
jgi:hypothetical protein